MWRQGAEGATEVRGFTLALTYNMKHTTVATKYDIFGEFRATWEMIMYNVMWKKAESKCICSVISIKENHIYIEKKRFGDLKK